MPSPCWPGFYSHLMKCAIHAIVLCLLFPFQYADTSAAEDLEKIVAKEKVLYLPQYFHLYSITMLSFKEMFHIIV